MLFIVLAAGCGAIVPDRTLHIRLNPDVERPARSAVIFFVDALDPTVLHELLAAGRLPHIRQRFVEGGVGVDHAVSSLPSITYPNCSSMITGRFPGHHDILGNFWFDRNSLTCRYYMTYGTYRTVNDHMTSPTLFDLLGEHFTINIQAHTRRGVTHTIDNERMFAYAWVVGRHTDADRYVGVCIEEAAGVANRVRRWPTVILTYYPGVDEVGHLFGPHSPEYAAALVNIDGVVGRVTAALDEAGLGGSTYCVLVSDHGMGPVDKRMDFMRWLRDARKMAVRDRPIDLPEYVDRFKLMERYNAVANVDAGRVAMVHLRGQRGWPYRPGPQEVLHWIDAEPKVLNLPAVQLVLTRAGEDRVQLLSREGSAMIERRHIEGQKKYRLADGQGDPLGYLADSAIGPFVREGWHTSREWLAATAGSRFPDFVPQAVEMFDSSRTGDVVVMAADHWQLYPREHGGHGSALPRDMRIALFFSGPDLPRGATIPHARLVDVMPTTLGLLGEEHRLDRVEAIDGINLADLLRSGAAR